jgi:hypothetical protein
MYRSVIKFVLINLRGSPVSPNQDHDFQKPRDVYYTILPYQEYLLGRGVEQ